VILTVFPLTFEEPRRETQLRKNMKVDYHIRGLKADGQLHGRLLAGLQELDERIPIARAAVVLERQRDSTPRYQALVLLAVPGPDIHAAARDHTWPAAWSKVTARLREQIQHRRNRQQARQKGERNLQTVRRRSSRTTRVRRT
jgi:ribosome-associated translation inhibitor RaiA